MSLLKIAQQLDMKIIAMAADGASTELGAQMLMDSEATSCAPLTYEYPAYGIRFRAPVFDGTGPLISVQDPNHGRKTARNQPQHGTHIIVLGDKYVVHRSLRLLQETGTAGLVRRDVENVDKQDDGAARRVMHSMALSAMTSEAADGKVSIKPDFEGLYPYLWNLGE